MPRVHSPNCRCKIDVEFSRIGGTMTLSSAWALAIPIIAAIFGGAAKYWNDLRIAQRKDRLERVNQQLRQLYGPLYAQIEAGDQAWAAFSKKFRSTANSIWHSQPPPTAEETAAWRLWM